MRDGSRTTRPMVRAVSSTLMETYTTAPGLMTKLTEGVFTAISMEPSMKETGSRISNMERVSRHGQMVLDTRVNTSSARSTVWVNSPGPTVALTTEPSRRTISKETEGIIGPMEEFSKDLGSTIRWRAKEYSLGLTAEDTRETTKMIRRRVRANSSGPTAESTRVAGKMESSMAKEPTPQLVENRSRVNGKMERDSIGSIRRSRINE